MSTNRQQLLNLADEDLFELDGEHTVGGAAFKNEAEPARKCSTCNAIIGVRAVTCDECWRYCMEGTSP